MKKSFKFLLVLFTIFFVGGCNNKVENEYETRMVSSTYGKENSIFVQNSDDEKILEANVLITNVNYSTFLGFTYKKTSIYGSGVIVNSDDNYYYLLTNNHVINRNANYKKNDILIEDYYGSRSKGEVLYSNVNYDLAMVRFEKKRELLVLEFDSSEVKVNEEVVSISNPSSYKNIVSEGKVSCFTNVHLDKDNSKVNFEVIVHDAYINNGSSGSALLNKENKIIGITYAGVFDNNGTFITGYAIPANRILEFLNM